MQLGTVTGLLGGQLGLDDLQVVAQHVLIPAKAAEYPVLHLQLAADVPPLAVHKQPLSATL